MEEIPPEVRAVIYSFLPDTRQIGAASRMFRAEFLAGPDRAFWHNRGHRRAKFAAVKMVSLLLSTREYLAGGGNLAVLRAISAPPLDTCTAAIYHDQSKVFAEFLPQLSHSERRRLFSLIFYKAAINCLRVCIHTSAFTDEELREKIRYINYSVRPEKLHIVVEMVGLLPIPYDVVDEIALYSDLLTGAPLRPHYSTGWLKTSTHWCEAFAAAFPHIEVPFPEKYIWYKLIPRMRSELALMAKIFSVYFRGIPSDLLIEVAVSIRAHYPTVASVALRLAKKRLK